MRVVSLGGLNVKGPLHALKRVTRVIVTARTKTYRQCVSVTDESNRKYSGGRLRQDAIKRCTSSDRMLPNHSIATSPQHAR
jgi:hypothetical protein